MKPEAVLGFAQVAGRLVSGDFAVSRHVQQGRVHLVIVASDAGRRTVRRYETLCTNYGVPWRRWGSKEQLGRLLGKPARSVVAFLDPAFASRFQEAISGEGEGSGLHDLR